MDIKKCTMCGKMLPLSEYYKKPVVKSGLQAHCKRCDYEKSRKYRKQKTERFVARCHERGIYTPMNENKECGAYLGVYIAETILSKYFKNITRLPHNTKGYDFICDNGFKIDVKCSTTRPDGCYAFDIEKNNIADYFLCLAFNNRVDLIPVKIWLIPGSAINKFTGIRIGIKRKSKYSCYEKPIQKVIKACEMMRRGEI